MACAEADHASLRALFPALASQKPRGRFAIAAWLATEVFMKVGDLTQARVCAAACECFAGVFKGKPWPNQEALSAFVSAHGAGVPGDESQGEQSPPPTP